MNLVEYLLQGLQRNLDPKDISLLSHMQLRASSLAGNVQGSTHLGLVVGLPPNQQLITYGQNPATVPTNMLTHTMTPVGLQPANQAMQTMPMTAPAPVPSQQALYVPASHMPMGNPYGNQPQQMVPMGDPVQTKVVHNPLAHGDTHTNIFGG